MKLNDLIYITLTEMTREILSTGVHTIVFTKKDGSERTMEATLDPTILENIDLSATKSNPPQYTNFYVTEVVDDSQLLKNFIFKNLKSIDGVPITELIHTKVKQLMQ